MVLVARESEVRDHGERGKEAWRVITCSYRHLSLLQDGDAREDLKLQERAILKEAHARPLLFVQR